MTECDDLNNIMVFIGSKMSSISRSTVRTLLCYIVLTTKIFITTVLYLTKTFVVETLYYCNLLCYVKGSTSLLTLSAVTLTLSLPNHSFVGRSHDVCCPGWSGE